MSNSNQDFNLYFIWCLFPLLSNIISNRFLSGSFFLLFSCGEMRHSKIDIIVAKPCHISGNSTVRISLWIVLSSQNKHVPSEIVCDCVCIKCSHCFRNSKMTLCLIFITWFMVYFGSLVETSNEKPVAFLSSSVAFVVALLFFSQWAHSGSVCVCVYFNRIIVFDKLNSTAQTAIPLKLNVKRHDTHSTAEMEWKNEPSNEEKTIGTKPRPITNLLCMVLIEFRVILRARSQFLTTVQYRNRQPKNVITYSNSHNTHMII